MKNIFYFIFFIVVLAIGLIFTIYNSDDVLFHYVVDSIKLPLSLIIVLAIITGVILALLASSIIIIRLRNELAQVKKNYKKKINENYM